MKTLIPLDQIDLHTLECADQLQDVINHDRRRLFRLSSALDVACHFWWLRSAQTIDAYAVSEVIANADEENTHVRTFLQLGYTLDAVFLIMGRPTNTRGEQDEAERIVQGWVQDNEVNGQTAENI